VANFTVGSSNFALAGATPLVLDEVLTFQSGGTNTFFQGLPFSGLDTDAQQILTGSIDDDVVGSALFENFVGGDIGGSTLYVTNGAPGTLEFVRIVEDRITHVDSFSLSGSDLTPAFKQYVKALAPNASHVQLVQETASPG
jgi:hypothetical protein